MVGWADYLLNRELVEQFLQDVRRVGTAFPGQRVGQGVYLPVAFALPADDEAVVRQQFPMFQHGFVLERVQFHRFGDHKTLRIGRPLRAVLRNPVKDYALVSGVLIQHIDGVRSFGNDVSLPGLSDDAEQRYGVAEVVARLDVGGDQRRLGAVRNWTVARVPPPGWRAEDLPKAPTLS